MSAKERAVELFKEHAALAATDGRLFRKTVMDTLQAETGCTLAAAATHYNNAKKAATPVAGLGRPTPALGVRKAASKNSNAEDELPDNECFTVMDIVFNDANGTVGRTMAFDTQGDASEYYDSRVEHWPQFNWVMIKGLGPNSGDQFKLEAGETEIKRYVSGIAPKPVAAPYEEVYI
jgi:hypothetical protein